MGKVALWLGLLSGVLFGIATPLSKLLLGSLNAFQLAGLLYLGAAITNGGVVFKKKKAFQGLWLQKAQGLKLLGVVLFGGLLGPLFLMLGLGLAKASSVAIWLNFELVATAVLGVWIFKDHLDLAGWIGVVMTLIAGVLTTFEAGSSGILPGFLVVLACSSWAVDNHLTAIIDGVDPEVITFIKGSVAGLINFTIGTAMVGALPTLTILGLALLVGMVSYGLSITLYVISAQSIGATRGQILFSTGPIWGVLAAGLLLGEKVTGMTLLSIGFLAAGVILTNVLSHEHDHEHTDIEHVHVHSHSDDHHDHSHLENDVQKVHSHSHIHHAHLHKHKHFPDLHHRHNHA
jgi:drug/metabolite transporter (DMT)-like permease